MIKLLNYIDGGIHGDVLHKKTPGEGGAKSVCTGAIVRPEGPEGCTSTLSQQVAEAKDFIDQYHASTKTSQSAEHHARVGEVVAALEETGTYTHTLEELEFAAKQAWRNAPRCIGRIQWKNLKVFDARHARSAADMFTCLKKHLKYATNGGNIRSAITIFPPRHNGREFLVYNSQLIQYAGYKRADGTVGDPASVELTELLELLGWQGEGGQFDVLPLLLQADGEEPQWFTIPTELVLQVQLRHPDYPWFEELGLRWYAIPAVANMKLEAGGLVYTAIPFNGWYMGTEIGARDLCDVQRYNILPTVAKAMQLDVARPASLWKDRALVEVNVAVLYSYQLDRVTITDHHTASESFIQHMAMETEARGGCPADWVWIVPPMSGSVCPVFHQEMVKYTLKPSYEYQDKPWSTDLRGRPCLQSQRQPANTKRSHISLKSLSRCIMAFLALAHGRIDSTASQNRITILYATETGRSLVISKQVASTLKRIGCVPKVVCMADYDVHKLQQERNLLVIASTFGSGDPPGNGQSLWKAMSGIESPNLLKNLRYTVLALGSSLYPQFCKFGRDVDKFLSRCGATSICPLQAADEMTGQEAACKIWMAKIIQNYSQGNHIQNLIHNRPTKRCRFLKDGNITPSNTVLGHLFNEKIKLMEVRESQELQAKGTMPRYMSLKMRYVHKEDNEEYKPGDYVQVYPGNTRKDVSMVLSKLNVTPQQHKAPLLLEVYDTDTGEWVPDERFPDPMSLYQLLTWFLDLNAPACEELCTTVSQQHQMRKSVIGGLIRQKKNSLQQKKVALTRRGSVDVTLTTPLNYIEALDQADPESIPPELLLGHVPTMKPRMYSVTSSYLYEKNKNNVHITYKDIIYLRNGIQCRGLATGFLTGIPIGHRLHVSFSESRNFRLSLAGTNPVLMVAQGTGITGFRAFWRCKMVSEKHKDKTNQAVGPLYLHYGCRGPERDFLYKKEIMAMKSCGILTDVKMAYSRDSKSPKTYVQDLLVQNTEMVGRLIYNDNGFLYYCGEIRHWDTVCTNVAEVLQSYTSMSKEKTHMYIQHMKAEGRLTKDIFID